jgi:hypothetical protein
MYIEEFFSFHNTPQLTEEKMLCVLRPQAARAPHKENGPDGGLPRVLAVARVVAHVHDRMQPQISRGVPCQVVQSKICVAWMVRDESIVSHVSALSHRRRRDDVFTCHVSDAGPNRAGDVHRPYGPESLSVYSVWTFMNPPHNHSRIHEVKGLHGPFIHSRDFVDSDGTLPRAPPSWGPSVPRNSKNFLKIFELSGGGTSGAPPLHPAARVSPSFGPSRSPSPFTPRNSKNF